MQLGLLLSATTGTSQPRRCCACVLCKAKQGDHRECTVLGFGRPKRILTSARTQQPWSMPFIHVNNAFFDQLEHTQTGVQCLLKVQLASTSLNNSSKVGDRLISVDRIWLPVTSGVGAMRLAPETRLAVWLEVLSCLTGSGLVMLQSSSSSCCCFPCSAVGMASCPAKASCRCW